MIQALLGKELIQAAPGIDATCPLCKAPVRSKCGEIITWHFAHHSLEDCDTWSEPESDWHRDWKLHVPAERREVVIGNHRADIVTANGTVVELQHSYIKPSEIFEREQHYGRMAWIFDLTDCADRFHIRQPGRRDLQHHGRVTFRWSRPRRHIAYTTLRAYLDLGDPDTLLMIGELYEDGGGYGFPKNRQDVIDWMNT